MADAVQTAYSVDAPFGNASAGMIVDSDKGVQVDTKIATGAQIGFGRGVVNHSGDSSEACRLPASAAELTDRFLGISVKDQTRRGSGSVSGAAQDYQVGDPVGVLRRGKIRVQCEETVAPGEYVYCRHTASGGNTTLGLFRNDDDSSTCARIPGAVFKVAGTTTVPAIVEINLPAINAATTGF